MILICPRCTSRFLLSAFVLAPDGRKVKCSSCDETWFQLPDPDELRDDFEKKPDDIPDSIKPVPRGSRLPVIKQENDINDIARAGIIGAVAAAVIFVLIAAVLVFMHDSVVRIWPPAHSIYELIGIPASIPGEGLVFDKIEAKANADGIIISGVIINLTREINILPDLLVALKDNDGNTLSNSIIELPEHTVSSEGVMPFEAQIPDSNGAALATIDFKIH